MGSKKFKDGLLVGQVELVSISGQQVFMTGVLQGSDKGTANHASMAGDEEAALFLEVAALFLVLSAWCLVHGARRFLGFSFQFSVGFQTAQQ